MKKWIKPAIKVVISRELSEIIGVAARSCCFVIIDKGFSRSGNKSYSKLRK